MDAGRVKELRQMIKDRSFKDDLVDSTMLDALDTIEELRGKNAELNRRCQSAESGLAQKIEDAKRQGGSFGRSLANASANMLDAENKELKALLSDCRMAIKKINGKSRKEIRLIERIDAKIKG